MSNSIKIILTAFSVLLIYSVVVHSFDENGVTVTENNSTHPVLFEIESCFPALLEIKEGRVHLRKKVASDYVDAEKLGLVTNGNIIRMEKGSVVVLYSCDGSSIVLGPYNRLKWFRLIEMSKR